MSKNVSNNSDTNELKKYNEKLDKWSSFLALSTMGDFFFCVAIGFYADTSRLKHHKVDFLISFLVLFIITSVSAYKYVTLKGPQKNEVFPTEVDGNMKKDTQKDCQV
jgi:hypothetical protein